MVPQSIVGLFAAHSSIISQIVVVLTANLLTGSTLRKAVHLSGWYGITTATGSWLFVNTSLWTPVSHFVGGSKQSLKATTVSIFCLCHSLPLYGVNSPGAWISAFPQNNDGKKADCKLELTSSSVNWDWISPKQPKSFLAFISSYPCSVKVLVFYNPFMEQRFDGKLWREGTKKVPPQVQRCTKTMVRRSARKILVNFIVFIFLLSCIWIKKGSHAIQKKVWKSVSMSSTSVSHVAYCLYPCCKS